MVEIPNTAQDAGVLNSNWPKFCSPTMMHRGLWCRELRPLLVSYNAVFCYHILSTNKRLTILEFFFKSRRVCWDFVQLLFEECRAVYLLHYRRGDWWWGSVDTCPSCKWNIIHLHINDINGKLNNPLVAVWSFVSEQIGKAVISSRVYLHCYLQNSCGCSRHPVQILDYFH